ncbi:MAG: hypothetical protein ACO3JT_03510 [Candidatus Nanopelagicales bacterium]
MTRSRMSLALTAALSLSLLVPVGAQTAPAGAGPAAGPSRPSRAKPASLG